MKNIVIAIVALFFFPMENNLLAQTSATDNKLSQTITFRAIPTGPDVFGVFEGRPPCEGIAKQLNIQVPSDCIKLKWSLALYHDPATLQPTTYALYLVGGGDTVKLPGDDFYLAKSLKGKLTSVKGIKSNPGAEVYGLELGKGSYLYLLKGDDNVLFLLDENKEFRVGNEDFSYTLNRVELVAGKK